MNNQQSDIELLLARIAAALEARKTKPDLNTLIELVCAVLMFLELILTHYDALREIFRALFG